MSPWEWPGFASYGIREGFYLQKQTKKKWKRENGY
jgi:hypothetical protein